MRMKFDSKNFSTLINSWLPKIVFAGIALICIFKVYTIYNQMASIEPQSYKSDVRILSLKSSIFFYCLLALSTISALICVSYFYEQSRHTENVLKHIEWTVERLAAIETTTTQKQNTDAKWPWGSHHTEALGHLEAAARRFWAELYDPTDPSTAPTNEMVEKWLMTERGVSKQKAAAIASILRLDGLRTGPR